MENKAGAQDYRADKGEGGEMQASYYSGHDLREMFSRENAERRRASGKTLRRYLTAAQDKQVMNKMVRIRNSHEVHNNDDVILVWTQQMIADGKEDEVHKALVEAAKNAQIVARPPPED